MEFSKQLQERIYWAKQRRDDHNRAELEAKFREFKEDLENTISGDIRAALERWRYSNDTDTPCVLFELRPVHYGKITSDDTREGIWRFTVYTGTDDEVLSRPFNTEDEFLLSLDEAANLDKV